VFLSESSDRVPLWGGARRRWRAGTAITFQRGLNLTIAMIHAEHSDKLPGVTDENPALRWNKKALLPRRHSC
jgi:hypothetical protein